MCVVVAPGDVERALRRLAELGETATRIGSVVAGGGEVRIHP